MIKILVIKVYYTLLKKNGSITTFWSDKLLQQAPADKEKGQLPKTPCLENNYGF